MFPIPSKQRKKQFFQAVQKNDVIGAKSLIRKVSLNAGERKALLQHVAQNGHKEMLDLLISHKYTRNRSWVTYIQSCFDSR